jgi:aspartyl-tRNA(Asn)/glutamyl-tRNA(Gln) amidotransferase subunit B
MSYESIIGLEIHIELGTKSKMFCACSAAHFGKKPNTQTCPVCLGLPGALPVPNKKAIEKTVLTGLAFGCQIPLFSKFDRKNYFYPDLPKGYQISQYELPFAIDGSLECKVQSAKCKVIRIRRVHLEEDTAKLIHQGDSTLIDFNRSGVPLMEIVTEPDLHSALEVKDFLQKLQRLVRYLGISDADMEKGQMRCEPTINLKISQEGKEYFTPLVELKNINSFRFVQKAIDYEIQRQQKEFEKTGVEKQPGNKTTRGWDETKNITVLQREKEEAHDYRYFPEPDIPPMRWTQSQILNLKSQIPELPEEKKKRFIKEYGLTEKYAEILVETVGKAVYFEEAVGKGKTRSLSPKEIANLIVNKRIEIEKLSPSELVNRLSKKKIAIEMSEKEVGRIINEVIKENQRAVEDYRKGKASAIEFLVGQVARKTKGQADPNLTRKLLIEKLKK